jgi:NAD(P)-dependent dehydrogenase (short-subunit alcohol dehydrogenase family)
MRMIALITGVGAKGQVGEAVAEAFLRRGDTVLIVSRSPDEAAERASELSGLGPVHGYPCDLAKPNEVARLADLVRSEHGDRLDALVNLAGGFGSSGPLAESDPSALSRMLDINLKTAYLATRAFLPMVMAARGSIVFFASEAVLEGSKSAGVAGYVAAKSAVVGLMRSVADEGRESGLRANALAPGAIRTATNEASMPAKKDYVEREEVAAAVLHLCSSAGAGVTSQVIRLR